MPVTKEEPIIDTLPTVAFRNVLEPANTVCFEAGGEEARRVRGSGTSVARKSKASGRVTFSRILRGEDSRSAELALEGEWKRGGGVRRRYRRAQKARKRPAAIRLAACDRRWHRTKLDGGADRRAQRRRGTPPRRGDERDGETCAGVSTVGDVVLERARNEEERESEKARARAKERERERRRALDER
ncbi:hypothetical protein K0M31_003488 [Melipona bicolor]|uniref:Uncharacterized protein n=1 Tax=Melipona bicolor TaxID=60889 RepID=A0AA40FZL6_9HYME|nr:hypothetical protein K0M31_003488 [Melipona bicolor]